MKILFLNNVYIDILLLLVINLFIKPEISFLICFSYLIYQIFQNHFLLIFPKVLGIKGYTILILLGFIIGIINNNLRSVVRDLFYILPTLLWFYIIYYKISNKNELNSIKKMFTTLFLFGGIISFRCLVNFITSFDFSFSNLRTVFGTNVYDVGFLFPITVYEIFFNNNIFISKRVDKLIVSMMALQIILCFGRIGIAEPIIALIIIFLFNLDCKKKNIIKIVCFLFCFGLLMVALYNVVPKEAFTELFTKLANSLQEINYDNTFNTYVSAINNWRGYEIHCAVTQWKESNLFAQIFGYGLGKGITFGYIPSEFDFVLNNEIPLLHNGFFSLLPKLGVLGFCSLASVYAMNTIYSLRQIKYREAKKISVYIIAICISGFANTWVVRGPVQQGSFLIWACMLTLLCTAVRKREEL